MEEKINELYSEYIKKKLPEIFNQERFIPKIRSNMENGYFFADKKGNNIFNEIFDEIFDFKNGYACVRKGNKWNLIDLDGKYVSREWFDRVYNFEVGYALVQRGHHEYNFIDIHGNLRFKKWFYYGDIKSNSFIKRGDKDNIECVNYDVQDYKIKKSLFGFHCSKKGDKFNIKYEPIKIYGRYILCLSKEGMVYVFDRMTNSYKELGNYESVEFDDNFIYTLDKNWHGSVDNKQVFLMYRDCMLDITDYHKEHLQNQSEILINPNIIIVKKEDFFYRTEEEIRRLLNEDKKQAVLRNIEEKKNDDQQRIMELKKTDEQKRIDDIIERKKALEALQDAISRLKSLDKGTIHHRVPLNNLFINVDDHLEIMPIILETNILKYIDLSMISFANVKIDGIDFRECNISLKPQEVYQKDLRGCNFEGLYIDPFMDFTGVDIRGARFSDDYNNLTMDRCNVTFQHAIYDETTTYNGISFNKIYGECQIVSSKTK